MAFPNVLTQLVAMLSQGKYRDEPDQTERQLLRETVTLLKPAADGAAGNATAYTAAHHFTAPRAGKLLGVTINPQAALTADNANNATVKAVKGDGAGGAETIMASVQTTVANGNWVAGGKKAVALSGTVANTRFAKGEVVGFSIAKTGTGVVVPICSLTLDIEWEGVDDYTSTT
jgi:hypothetical protein